MRTKYALTQFAGIAFGILGGISVVVMPMLVGLMINLFGLSSAAAGRVASGELLGVALGSLAVATLVSRWPLKAVAVLNVACIVIGNALTIGTAGEHLHIARLIAGVGAGGSIALMSAIVATSHAPDRLFGVFFSVLLLLATVFFYSAELVAQHLGEYGMYFVFIALSLCSVMLSLLFVPPTRRVPASVQAHSTANAPVTLPTRWGIVGAGLFAMFLFFAGCGAVWVYMERIGVANGLDPEAARSVLGSATIAGAIGACLATLAGVRFGRLAPLLLAGSVLLLMMAMIAFGLNAATFPAVALGFVLTWMFTLPYLMGTMAVIDPLGRAASLAVGFQNGGQALGPAVASLMIAGTNYSRVGVMGLSCLLLSLAVYVFVFRRTSSSNTPVAQVGLG
jgi:predicted MFS family arabinose efflux permease